MENNNEHPTFTERVISVQRELKAPKNQYNKFGKYRYRNAEDILNSVKPILADRGLLLTLTDDIKIVSHRIYVVATARLSDGESEVSAVAYAREDETLKGMTGSQITGAASSYARKYALNGLFCIDDTRDADATNDGTLVDNSNEERVIAVIKSINAAPDRVALTQIWNNNNDLQSDARVVQAIGEAAKKFPKK